MFEKGGDTLSSLLFDIQGESFRLVSPCVLHWFVESNAWL